MRDERGSSSGSENEPDRRGDRRSGFVDSGGEANSERWLELRLRAPADAETGPLVEELVALGGSAVQESDGELITYCRRQAVVAAGDPERFATSVREALRPLVPDGTLELAWRWCADEDWSKTWREGLRPRRIGRRTVVTPSWREPDTRPGDVVITIDPEMAFGTGEHATTRGALRLTDEAVRPGDHILDVGTGSGVLAIAAARFGAAEVTAVEKDPRALENARENIRRNGVAGRVDAIHGSVDAPFLEMAGPGRYDVIVANVLSGVLEPLLPAFARVLDERGRLILGGILEHEADGMIEAAGRAGLALQIEDLEDAWWSALFTPGPEAGSA